jgi:hypothetical protein
VFALLTKLLAGPLIDKVLNVFVSMQNRKATEAEVRAAVEKEILSTFSEVAETQASVLKAEITGEDWLQRNWRPIVAVSFSFVLLFYSLLMPILVSWFGVPPVRTGDLILEWTYDTVLLCLGGYIGGRTIEKVVRMVKQ